MKRSTWILMAVMATFSMGGLAQAAKRQVPDVRNYLKKRVKRNLPRGAKLVETSLRYRFRPKASVINFDWGTVKLEAGYLYLVADVKKGRKVTQHAGRLSVQRLENADITMMMDDQPGWDRLVPAKSRDPRFRISELPKALRKLIK